MSNDTHRAYSSVATVLAIGAIGGMVLTGWASQPRAAVPPVVITLAAPAPVAAAPAPAPVAAAPVKAAPVAAAPVKAAPVKRKAVRKAAAPAPVARVVYLVPRWNGCTCSL